MYVPPALPCRSTFHTLAVRAMLCLGLLASLVACGGSASAAERPPNIVFFVADDLGWADLGCYGSTFYETPHLDRLAEQGARFTNGYAACPVCSPTRAALLTGKYPVRTGVTDYINPGGANQPEKWNRPTPLLPAPYEDRLALQEVTFAEALQEAGYATFYAGKWHLGPEGFYPEDQGFNVNYGGHEQGGPYGGKKYFSPYNNPRLKDGPPGEHLPDRLASEAAQFLEDHRDEPVLIYFPFYSVHTPLMARKDLQQKYEQKRERLGLEAKFGRERQRNVRLVQEHAVYAGMVEALDAAVGKVLTKLDELGLTDNTIIIFTSDNGGLSTSEGHPTSNLPLRAGKGWLYEGGIRVPLLVRWPGEVKPGSVIEEPVTSTDFYPTLLEATGQPARPEQHVDGVSLVALLKEGKRPEPRSLFWHYPHYGNQGSAPGAAIRRENWKLIEWQGDVPVELYNLAEDLSEKQNLAEQYPDLVQELRDQLHTWQKATGARFASPNPKFKKEEKTQR